eukprot:SAG11_NODE_85_length_17370_cov_29.272017_17_plen_501_part_00
MLSLLFILKPCRQDKLPLAQRVAPGSVALRARILAYLNKSELAANSFPSSLEAIVGSAFGAQPGEAGESLLRVKVLGMEFTRWVVKRGAEPNFTPMAPVLYKSLLKSIGATAAGVGGAKSTTLRGLTFNAIAEVALRSPGLVDKETTLVRLLFEVLRSKDEDDNVRTYVREALSSLIGVYRSASEELRQELALLLKGYFVRTELPDVRFIVVYWSNELFTFDHVPSRLINLMAVADSKSDIADEARLGLLPSHHVVSGGLKTSLRLKEEALPAYPSFHQMIDEIISVAPELLGCATQGSNAGERALPFEPQVCGAMLEFLQGCIADELKRGSRDGVRGYFGSMEAGTPECLDGFLALIGAMFGAQADARLQRIVASAVELVAAGLEGLHSERAHAFSRSDRLAWLKRWLLQTGDEETQERVASSLGAVAAGMGADGAAALATALCKIAANSREGVGERYGALVAIGTLAGQQLHSGELMLNEAGREEICRYDCSHFYCFV